MARPSDLAYAHLWESAPCAASLGGTCIGRDVEQLLQLECGGEGRRRTRCTDAPGLVVASWLGLSVAGWITIDPSRAEEEIAQWHGSQ